MNTAKCHIANLYIMLLLVGMAPAIGAEQVAWNGPAALQLSDDLFSAARQLSIECRQSPPRYDDNSSSGHLEFRYHVRHFLSIANDLSLALEDGKSKNETKPIFETLENMMIDLKRYSEKKAGGPWPAVSKAVLDVDAIIVQLSAYYN